MYYVTVNLPNLVEGAEVELDGLGIFVNGETKEVSREEANAFMAKHATSAEVYDSEVESDDERVVVGRVSVPGPSLAQYYKDSPYVTVSTTDPRKKSLEENDTHEDAGQVQTADGKIHTGVIPADAAKTKTTPKEKVNN